MHGTRVGRRLVAVTAAAALVVGACDPTPSVTPRPAVSTPPSTAEPAPSPTARPTPAPTLSGVVEVAIREIRGAEGRLGASGVWTGSEVLVWGGLWFRSFYSPAW